MIINVTSKRVAKDSLEVPKNNEQMVIQIKMYSTICIRIVKNRFINIPTIFFYLKIEFLVLTVK